MPATATPILPHCASSLFAEKVRLALGQRACLRLGRGAAEVAEDLAPGTRVTITSDDFARMAVTGTLLAADARAVVVHHTRAEAGDLHLSRAGLGEAPA